MAQFTVEQLQTLQSWMLEKGINKCPLCGSEDGFTNVVEIGQAELSKEYGDGYREEGYMEDRFGEVEPILLTSQTFGDVVSRELMNFQNSFQRKVDSKSINRVVKGLMDTLDKYRGSSVRHKAARITCGNCRYILLLDTRKIGV